jgi:hypothetical protein
MAIQISISNAIGSRYRGSVVPPIDPDAQAFITAAAITDPTQQSAINQLVLDLKGYSIWTKFKAIYPVVGGTAASHKWNLKDPRDLDAAFRLTFATGWTHSANGMTPNGTSAYANTYLNTNTQLNVNSHSFGIYSRTNNTTGSQVIGVYNFDGSNFRFLQNNLSLGNFVSGSISNIITYTANPSTSLLMLSRTSSTLSKAFRAGVLLGQETNTVGALSTYTFYLGARNNTGNPDLYSSHQLSFAFLGDGLTDTDAANFYTAVQAYQTTLGRSIGTQTVSDPDAQAFINAAAIDDQVQANAINNLVIGLKADGLWTKMKAIYPVVGGSASSHAVNLKTPGTFNLTFTNAWNHASTGMTPNGTSAYANTGFNPLTQSLPRNSAGMGVYNRTDTSTTGAHGQRVSNTFEIFERWTNNVAYCYINDSSGGFQTANLDSRGLFQGSRTASNAIRLNINTTQNTGAQASTGDSNGNLWIGASNNGGSGTFFNNREIAFFYIGEGFNNTEMQNIYTRVQAFQTTLNRQV